MAMMSTSLYRMCPSINPKVLLCAVAAVFCLFVLNSGMLWSSDTLRIELNINRVVQPEEAVRLYSGDYLLCGDQNPSDKAIIDKQRQNIQQELYDNPPHPGLGVNQLVPELGGKAVSTLLVTSWRFGSTFLGAVLNAHPATFYHYEPLHDFGIVQVRSGDLAKDAVTRISQLLHCDYSDLNWYMKYSVQYKEFMLAENKRLWWVCNTFTSFCRSPMFMSAFCKLFPYNLAKLTRLRMALTEPLLKDPTLAVKVILLVRDPRGSLNSRLPWDWCRDEADCANPDLLCKDMVSDYKAAVHLQKKFPGRVQVIRFEDLAPNQFNVTKSVYDFLSFSFSSPVQQFLHEHTKSNDNANPFNTFRDSAEVHLNWRKGLTFEEVTSIQSQCQEAMHLFGYRPATDANSLPYFDPVDKFNFPSP